MTNKIVILDDSVILHEHYISDNKWERTMAFPRGGLTYLISNGTIKFYAYEDYFYKNCLISMQLPIYIVDEHMHIDGEYENVEDLTSVLDRIFPTNDMDAQLDTYLKIIDAELLYQPIGDYLTKTVADTLYMPIGDYVTDDELVDVLEDYYTKAESDARYQPKGDYCTTANTYSKTEINNYISVLQNQISALTDTINECCSTPPTPTIEYRWNDVTSVDNYMCVGTSKHSKLQRQFRVNGGEWIDVEPSVFSAGTVIELYSEDCGFDPSHLDVKLKLTYRNGNTYKVYCTQEGNTCMGEEVDAITKEMVRGGTQAITNIVRADVGDCTISIMGDAFSGCSSLQKVTLPQGFSSVQMECNGIDGNAFEGCALRTIGLKDSGADLEFNENIVEIPYEAFKDNTHLTRVELPSTFSEFAPRAFEGCYNLETIIINSTSIPILNAWAQDNYRYDGLSNIGNDTFKIYVRDDLVETYKSQPTSTSYRVGYRDWGNYADKIYPISELNS